MGSVELKDLIGPKFFFSFAFAFALDTGTTSFLYSKSLCYNNSKEGFKTHFQLAFVFMHFLKANITTEDERSTSVFSLYWQISQGQMANFPAFIALKYFDL